MVFRQLQTGDFDRAIWRKLTMVAGLFMISVGSIAQPVDTGGLFSPSLVDGELYTLIATPCDMSVTVDHVDQGETASTLEQQIWILSRDDRSLRRSVTNWVQSAHWRLQWDAPQDVPISRDMAFSGDFVTVMHAVISTLAADHLFAVVDNDNHLVRITAIGPE